LKEELGLDHFEDRSWQGLYCHALMIMVAYAFLQHRHLGQAEQKKQPRRAASAQHPGCAMRRHRRPHSKAATTTM